MKKSLSTLLFLAFVVACLVAMHYGSIWDSQVYPIQNVTVMLSGHEYVGELSRTWNNAYRLVEQGHTHIFTEQDGAGMAFHPSTDESFSMLKHWRVFAGVWLAIAGLICLVWHSFGKKLVSLSAKPGRGDPA